MLKRICDGLVYRLKGCWGTVNGLFFCQPIVLSTIESLTLIGREKSIARFGDGEFNVIRGQSLGFQKYDSSLAERLREVLHNDVEKLEIGIPNVFGTLKEYNKKSASFWRAYLGMYRKELVHMLDLERTYCNTNMTRFWSGYRDKRQCKAIIEAYREIWSRRDVVFVEGKLTRMGVGNNLFSNAKSVKRILCPAENAWSRYSEIFDTIKSNIVEGGLYILALGPTATVLAYDMCKFFEGKVQVLDLGHIDVQYEYYLRKAEGKIALEGKYVNENNAGTKVSDEIIDAEYMNSIIACIE